MSLLNAGRAGLWHDSGQGKIVCAKAPVRGIQPRLLQAIEQLVDDLGFSLVIASVDTGQHVIGSRHYLGHAADISDIHVYGREPTAVSVANPQALAMVRWLVNQGFVAGHENGPEDAVLLGPPGSPFNQTPVDHSDHAHVSTKRVPA